MKYFSGVLVDWKLNPLESTITLTDVGRLKLQLGVAADMLGDAYTSICLFLADTPTRVLATQFVGLDV
jgi:hypothetical protein